MGALLALVLAGCGGGGGSTARGEVSGVVFDIDGKPVRGARVFVDNGGHRETFTDSAGAYVLTGVAAKDLLVKARTIADGTTFVGQNLARVFGNERDLSVNITLVAENSQARLVGQVTDGTGRVVRDLRVVIRPTDDKTLSSASALTDRDGFYSIDGLMRGVEYRVLANGLGYGEDSRVLTISSREARQDLTLGAPSNPNLAPPQNLDAVAYTTPGDITTRSLRQKHAYESIKRLLDPDRAARLAKRKTVARDTASGRPIEVDLFWDDYTTIDTVGFGIYRRLGSGGADTPFFLQDPLAVYFADGDAVIRENTTYSYAITAINSSFDDNPDQGESAFSNRVSVTPLGDLRGIQFAGTTVSWQGVAGADDYTVFAYNEYPGIGVLPINGSSGQTTTGTSLSVPNATAYVVVVGERSDGSARTLSQIVAR